MIKVIGSIKFFKDAKELTQNHLREICRNLEIKHMSKNEDVVEYNTVGEHFYVILSGLVGIYTPNPMIENWREKYLEY